MTQADVKRDGSTIIITPLVAAEPVEPGDPEDGAAVAEACGMPGCIHDGGHSGKHQRADGTEIKVKAPNVWEE